MSTNWTTIAKFSLCDGDDFHIILERHPDTPFFRVRAAGRDRPEADYEYDWERDIGHVAFAEALRLFSQLCAEFFEDSDNTHLITIASARNQVSEPTS